jgi:hypothetical protein
MNALEKIKNERKVAERTVYKRKALEVKPEAPVNISS